MNSHQGEIQVSILKTIEGEEELRERWNAIVLQMETRQVFFTYEWALAVERAFKSTIQPWIFTVTKHDKLIGVVALACDLSDSRKLFFLSASTGDYCDVISAPSDREEVVNALLREFRNLQIHRVFLASIPKESNTLRVLAQSKNISYWNTSQPAYTCRRIVFDRKSVNAATSGPVKTERLRRLAKLGEINLFHLRKPEEIEPALNFVIKAQISRFLITGRLSPLLKTERRQLLAELTSLLSPQQWIDLSILKLNGRDIAWHFGFQFEGTLFWYLPTFDSSLEMHSPGACLLNLVNDENWNKPALKEIDLGLGDESYKEHFANAQRETFNVHFSASFASHCGVLLRDALRKTIKRLPRIERFVRAVLNRKARSSAALLQRIFAKFFFFDETIFFESTGDIDQKESLCQMEVLNWNNLADLALQNSEDPDMLEYLQQTSPRLRLSKKKNIQGFVVREAYSPKGQFFWIDEMSGPDHENPKPPALVFDHYTPASILGKQLQKAAIECVAAEIKKQGKTPWISVKHTNQDTLQALKNSSFHPRYTIIRRKFIFAMPSEKQFFDPQSRP